MQYPEIKWRNILILLAILSLAWIVPIIWEFISSLGRAVGRLAERISFMNFDIDFPPGSGKMSEPFQLACLCALFIFIGGILRMLLSRRDRSESNSRKRNN